MFMWTIKVILIINIMFIISTLSIIAESMSILFGVESNICKVLSVLIYYASVVLIGLVIYISIEGREKNE